MKSIRNAHQELKLHEINNIKLEKLHTTELGLKIPSNYFLNSKNEILNKINKENARKKARIQRKKWYWIVAASLIFLLGFSVYNSDVFIVKNEVTKVNNQVLTIKNEKPVKINSFNTNTADQLKITTIAVNLEDDVVKQNVILDTVNNNFLVQTLFIDENQLPDYVTNFMLEDI